MKLTPTTRIVIGLALALCLIATSAIIGSRHLAAPRVFDPVRWRQAVVEMKEWRKDMYRDLLRQHDMVGWTEEQVISLLGEPDGRSTPVMYYWLGQEDTYPGIDDLHLYFRFEKGRVDDVLVRTE